MIVKERGCVCREGLLGRGGGNKEHSVCGTKAATIHRYVSSLLLSLGVGFDFCFDLRTLIDAFYYLM